MYKVKMGLHIFCKKFFLNLLVMLQLFIIIGTLNTVVLASTSYLNMNIITKRLSDEQLIYITGQNFNETSLNELLSELRGVPIPYHSDVTTLTTGETHRGYERIYLISIDNYILTKLNYSLYKGRWFIDDDAGQHNVVLSYTTKYKVGDTIKILDEEIPKKIIGIMPRNEQLFKGTGFSSDWEFLFASYEDDFLEDTICMFRDITVEDKTFLDMGGIFIGFDEKLTDEDYEYNVKTLTDTYRLCLSTQQLAEKSNATRYMVFNVMIPIVVFISLICLFSFIMISLFSMKSCRRDLDITHSLGASKKDINLILGVYISIPIIILAILLASLSRVSFVRLMSGGPVKITYLNHVVSLSVLMLFALINYFILTFTFHRNKGVKDEIKHTE